MSKERLYLFDTTLRDGAQTTGVDFSLEDKRRIATLLDDLGSTTSRAAIPAPTTPTRSSSSRSRRSEDRALHGVRHDQARRPFGLERSRLQTRCCKSAADSICLVAKSWDYHVRVALGISNEENLAGIAESITRRRRLGP